MGILVKLIFYVDNLTNKHLKILLCFIFISSSNFRNETSLVSLRILNDQGRKVLNAAYGLPYTLRAEMSKPDGL